MTSFDFRQKNINETKNYILDEIKHNNSINEKHKKFKLFSLQKGVSISAFTSLVAAPVGVVCSVVG